MEREVKSVSKTARFDIELINKVMARLEKEAESEYRRLKISDALRYGLMLVLAAYGDDYKPPDYWQRGRFISARAPREDKVLEAAIATLKGKDEQA